ncbi:MAG: OmpA family protein [Flavobacteriaceae bacterium]
MKKRTGLLLICLLVFSSCKNEINAPKESVDTETETPIPEPKRTEEPEQQQKEPEMDLVGIMGTVGNLLTGTTKDSTGQGLFTEHGELNVDFLKTDAGKPLRKTFAQMAGVKLEEVDHIVFTIKPSHNIVSVKHAQEIENTLHNPDIETYISSGRASEKFLNYIDENRAKAKERTADFKARAQQAKEEFYQKNPSWFALDETTEDTFIDSRKKMVYLPLGDLSFADSVVSFQPGRPSGRTPEKGLGSAQGNADVRTDCAVLGIEGQLTLFFEDNAIIDVNGPDIYVFEIGEIEPTNLEISKDGENWITVGKIEGGTAFVDIADYVKSGEIFNYVRFTDLDTYSGQPGADIDAVATIGGAMRMNLDSAVLFETGSHILKEEGILAIKELALQMKNLSKGSIRIEGHTDDVGGSQSNQELSKKRAASVAAELKKAITSPKFRWEEKGYGESQPLVLNDSDENRAKNRRVEILVTPY